MELTFPTTSFLSIYPIYPKKKVAPEPNLAEDQSAKDRERAGVRPCLRYTGLYYRVFVPPRPYIKIHRFFSIVCTFRPPLLLIVCSCLGGMFQMNAYAYNLLYKKGNCKPDLCTGAKIHSGELDRQAQEHAHFPGMLPGPSYIHALSGHFRTQLYLSPVKKVCTLGNTQKFFQK